MCDFECVPKKKELENRLYDERKSFWNNIIRPSEEKFTPPIFVQGDRNEYAWDGHYFAQVAKKNAA